MPSDSEPFLQRIRAFPDDDSHRLIFADWLEEQGTREANRAAFIRIQVALASLPSDDPRRPTLLVAERELLDAYREEWEGPLRGLATGPEFRRGFVEEVKVAARQFLRHADELFAAGPIRGEYLGGVPAPMGEMRHVILGAPFVQACGKRARGQPVQFALALSRRGKRLKQAFLEVTNSHIPSIRQLDPRASPLHWKR